MTPKYTKLHSFPVILSIDTSCDETSCAVTQGLTVLSNVVWSQSKIHSKFGGVVPSTARREHERKIFWVAEKSVNTANITYRNLDAISVTFGPGLAIALGVGINFAKDIAIKYKKPLLGINHLEGHLFSALAEKRNTKYEIRNTKQISRNKFQLLNKHNTKTSDISTTPQLLTTNYQLLKFPAFGIVVSGGNTLLVLIEKIGKYKVLAQTMDDALGESLDKSARLLGLGYPGGAILEKFAKNGNQKSYPLPIPMLGREGEGYYSYSGLKTAFNRKVQEITSGNDLLSKQQIFDLAASYQNTSFEHFIRVTKRVILSNLSPTACHLFVGGGVAANVELRKKIRSMCNSLNLTPLFPYSKKLYGDNAAMIGIAAYLKYLKKDFTDPSSIDRMPDLKIDHPV